MRVSIKPNQRVVRITDADILNHSHLFKSHRMYIGHKFKEMGYEVTEWHSRYNGEQKIVQGLEYLRTDSDVMPTVEVVGTIGVNIRPLTVIEVTDATGNQVQAEGGFTPRLVKADGTLV